MKALRILYVCLALAVAGLLVWFVIAIKKSPDADRVKIKDSRVENIKSMADLCSMEIYRDIPIKASIGTRHLFARMSVRGSISYDLDAADIDTTGDTIVITLPKEKVEFLESTDPDSYQIIDVWNDHFLGSVEFTAAEENAIKEKYRQSLVNTLYRDGTVGRARKEATENLKSLASALYNQTVIVK